MKFKAYLKRKKRQFNKFFSRKVIVYCTGYPPAELRDKFKSKGRKYIRIAITNRQEISGYDPTTDVPFELVTKYEYLPSPFTKKVWAWFGRTPKAETINLTIK